MTNRQWGLLFLVACCWGGSFLAYSIGTRSLPVSTLVMYRIDIAAIALWLCALIWKWEIPRGSIWIEFCAIGFLTCILPFYAIGWGQQFIPSGLASILNSTTALFATCLTPLLIKSEQATLTKIIGVILGFIGVSIAIGLNFLSHFSLQDLGQLAILLATFSYAISGIWSRKRIKAEPKIMALGMLTTASFMITALHFAINPNGALLPSFEGALATGFIAIISTAFAYVIFFKLMREVGVMFATLTNFLVPVVGITLGAIFLSETLDLNVLIGFGFIGFGLAIIDGRIIKLLTILRLYMSSKSV